LRKTENIAIRTKFSFSKNKAQIAKGKFMKKVDKSEVIAYSQF